MKLIKKGLLNLQSFDRQYVEANIDSKRVLTSLIFPNKFGFKIKKFKPQILTRYFLKLPVLIELLEQKRNGTNSTLRICPVQ